MKENAGEAVKRRKELITRRMNRGVVCQRLADAPDAYKQEIWDKYRYDPEETSVWAFTSDANHAMAIGTFADMIARAMMKSPTEDEIERMIVHSIVLIDCKKRMLNVKKSYEDNGIKEIVDKYFPEERKSE